MAYNNDPIYYVDPDGRKGIPNSGISMGPSYYWLNKYNEAVSRYNDREIVLQVLEGGYLMR